MFDIVYLSNVDRSILRDMLNRAETEGRTVRIAMDTGYLKVKVGEGMWTAPMGYRE